MVPGLSPVPVPPALWGGLIPGPTKVLPGQVVPHLDLIELRGESLGAPSYHAVRLLALGHPVFCLGGPLSSPLACLLPLLLRDLPLEVGEGSQKGHGPHLCSAAVFVIQPFYPLGVRLLCHDLCPPVGFLVASDTLVGWAPSDFNDDTRRGLLQDRNVLSDLKRILLAGAGLVRTHPPDGSATSVADASTSTSRLAGSIRYPTGSRWKRNL